MGTDKAMLPWPPPPQGPTDPPRHTLLSAALLAFDPFTRLNIVVAGRNADAIAAMVGACGANLVRNPAPEKGQFSSLQIGLRDLLDPGCNAAIITPVDCPPLNPSSLERLHHAFLGALTADFWAVAPEHDGKHGHPLLANRDLIDAFLKAPITGNAREVLHAHASRVVYVPVPESLAKAGLNTPQDYAAAEWNSPEI
jgi:molybdenum cofactor cytidylyltransferase